MFIEKGYWTVSPKNLELINLAKWDCKKVPCDIYVDEEGQKYRNYEVGFKSSRPNPFSRYIK